MPMHNWMHAELAQEGEEAGAADLAAGAGWRISPLWGPLGGVERPFPRHCATVHQGEAPLGLLPQQLPALLPLPSPLLMHEKDASEAGEHLQHVLLHVPVSSSSKATTLNVLMHPLIGRTADDPHCAALRATRHAWHAHTQKHEGNVQGTEGPWAAKFAAALCGSPDLYASPAGVLQLAHRTPLLQTFRSYRSTYTEGTASLLSSRPCHHALLHMLAAAGTSEFTALLPAI